MANDSGGCCSGKEIDLKELGRTASQKDIGNLLAGIIKSNIGRGATPFTGQLSQAPDPGMTAGMNTMMNIGGYGAYKPPGYPTGAPPPPRGINPPPGGWNDYEDYGGDGDGGMENVPGQTGTGTPEDPYTVIGKKNLRDPNKNRGIYIPRIPTPMPNLPGQRGMGTRQHPYQVIGEGNLRDPGYRNPVPPGSSRNIEGGTSGLTPAEIILLRLAQRNASGGSTRIRVGGGS